MTETDFRRIETELGAQLPDLYRAVLRDYSFGPNDHFAQGALLNEADQIIDFNQDHLTFDPLLPPDQQPGATWWDRFKERYKSEARKEQERRQRIELKQQWADRFFIGSDGGEESYFVRLHEAELPVYTYDLETDSVRQTKPSLKAWVAYLHEVEAELAEEFGE